MLQVKPDWSTSYASTDALETDLRFEYGGPGFYLWQDCTILVVARAPNGNPENCWDTEQPEHTVLSAYVWNYPFHETIFSQVIEHLVPARLENRGVPKRKV